MICALLLSLAAQGLPERIIQQDDELITESCRVVIPAGLVIEDGNQNGVIQIQGDGLTVQFSKGSVLRGADGSQVQDLLQGTGISIQGAKDLTLRGARVEGFRCGIHAVGADNLRIEGAFLQRNYGQRLRSTPEAEDTADWLWPHANDQQEWRRNYGAALYIERCQGVLVHNVKVRNQQNGIILDRVSRSRIFDNDCSFLSGWGLAMWRSNGNVISRNAFDFCIRGYSHGIYNRGQDSAGILLFEQCSKNAFVENSATHGGDGLFGFAGREALGEAEVIPDGFSSARAGCNDNLFLKNDFSFAAAHGWELTFSFGNVLRENNFDSNAICGIWGGFSQETKIIGNTFRANGDKGYGLERGGINIDHSRNNWVNGNQFIENQCGIHLWSLPTSFEEKPWGLANDLTSTQNYIFGNVFQKDKTAVQLRGAVTAAVWNNQYPNVDVVLDVDSPRGIDQVIYPKEMVELTWPGEQAPVFGNSHPVGARKHLAGRQNIVMGEWGPWDHQTPLLRSWTRTGDRHLFRVEPAGLVAKIVSVQPASFPARLFMQDGSQYLELRAPQAGHHSYSCKVKIGDTETEITGSFLSTDWEIRFFAFTPDPRENVDGWRAKAMSEQALVVHRSELRLAYGSGGPKDLSFIKEAKLDPPTGADAFGTRAITQLQLPSGKWRLRTLSDDGVRVYVDGDLVIDNWTWHAPVEDIGIFELDQAKDVEILVEHFELNGYAVLELDLEPMD